ncbi:MAG: hypothetical protein WDW36_000635 [Sanguina aurantia]
MGADVLEDDTTSSQQKLVTDSLSYTLNPDFKSRDHLDLCTVEPKDGLFMRTAKACFGSSMGGVDRYVILESSISFSNSMRTTQAAKTSASNRLVSGLTAHAVTYAAAGSGSGSGPVAISRVTALDVP